MTSTTSATTDTTTVDEPAPCHGYFLIGGTVVPKKLSPSNSTRLDHEFASQLWVWTRDALQREQIPEVELTRGTSTGTSAHPSIHLPLDQSAASSTADNIEQELLCESELARRFALFVCDAENERFEDGMGSEFANRVRESIVNYGPVAVAAWERVLWRMENANETGEELLRQLGLIEHHPSHARRLRVLKDSLKSPDSRIRDAASLGLSFLDDTSALLALQSAYGRETEGWLKENLKLVIDQLMDSDNAEIPQSGTSGSLV